MKRLKFFILMMCFCSVFFNFTAYASRPVGTAVNTDIVAYVNGLPIKSYNIDGQTLIIAEDLSDYGFRVNYYNEYRLLMVEYEPEDNKEITADYVPEENTKPIGSFAFNVYSTDIVAEINGKEVPSYNIGGRTLIPMDSLEVYGDVVWDPDKREISFSYVPNWEINIPDDYESDTSANITGFTLELKRNGEGNFDVSGENRQYVTYASLLGGREPNITFKFSIYQNVNAQTAELSLLLAEILNSSKGEFIKDDISFANEHIKVFINNEPAEITYVLGGGGNGHSDYTFTIDKQIKDFKDLQSFKIECGQ